MSGLKPGESTSCSSLPKTLALSTLTIANIGATDHVPFDEIGLPAFEWIRDYMEGDNTRAPHTNMDTYDHVLEDDL